jgi:osomolarity two-component system response regulator SSK1
LPNANLTAQLLSYIHAECTVDQDTDTNQTKFEFSFDLDTGKKDIINKMFISKDSTLLKNHYANIKFSNEPSLKDLLQFIEHLKGLKMVLHAPEQSIFAKHLTSCLASWNTDISHVPVMQIINDETSSTATSQGEFSDHSSVNTPNIEHTPQQPRIPTTPPVPSPAIEEEHIHSIPPAFILIDDDIATLETKLNEFRLQPPASASTLQAQHYGRRSHFHAKKPSVHQQNLFHQGTTAIIHFTSLTKYKAVRDTIQSYAFLPSRDPFSMPRVVVVPKPAGPRRFLTALHTAWHNAVVEPHFSAIATAPSSPMPPAISMWMQRELNSNITSPGNNITGGITPTSASNIENVSPGRRARPLSGIFNHHQSPPVTATGDTNNYFTSQQASPGAATSNGRRRSANNANATPTTTATTTTEDYLTAKHVPLMNALGVVSPAAAMAAAASMATPCSSSANVAAATTTPGITMDEAGNHSSGMLTAAMDSTATSSSNDSSSALLNNTTGSVEVSPEAVIDRSGISESVSASAVPNDAVEPTKKKLSRTMSNFKLHKKKRKAKGTPFADVVSPPINVLIVEGIIRILQSVLVIL